MISLVLSDDWELRGDGSGNMVSLQFRPMRALMDLYERYGVRGTFNAEVLQQLAHREWGRRVPELASLADAWDACIVECVSRGHDVQLHLHPQWTDAAYDGGWRLGGRWLITDYTEAEARDMVRRGRQYLEALIRPHVPEYRVVSFRGGSWALAPSPFMLQVLADNGIVFDMSIVPGVAYRLPMGRLDYRDVDEGFFPYYPDMDDARRMADAPQPVVCVPTNTFPAPPRLPHKLLFLLRALGLTRAPGLRGWLAAPFETPHPDSGVARTYGQRWMKNGSPGAEAAEEDAEPLGPVPRIQIADLSQLCYAEMRHMLRWARRRAANAHTGAAPVILENHTKDAGDLAPIERLLRTVAGSADLEVVTASELAGRLQAGHYPVRTR